MHAPPAQRGWTGLGTTLISSVEGVWRGIRFGGAALADALTPSTYTPAVRASAARQVCAAAWSVLPGVIVFCAILSYVVIRIVVETARDYGLAAFALDIFVRVLVLELIPLFIALFVALRSGAALGTQIALMQMHADGASPEETGELRAKLLPRGIGNALAVLSLTAIGCAVALVVAYVALYGFSPWGHAAYSRAIGQVFEPVILVGFALKVALFAIAVGVIPVAAGLGAARNWQSVADAAPLGMVRLFVGLALVEAVSLAGRYV